MRGPSTLNLDAMPAPEALWKTCVSLDDVDPTYTLDTSWPVGPIFKRDNGNGARYVIAFVKQGVFIRGFDLKSPLSPYVSADGKTIWTGMFRGVPKGLDRLVNEPRLERDPRAVTFCITYAYGADEWETGVKRFPPDYIETTDR